MNGVPSLDTPRPRGVRVAASVGLVLGDGVLSVREHVPAPDGPVALALAVMEQALFDLSYPPESGTYHAARDWFQDDDRAWVFSAARICELFGWDLSAVRARLWHVHAVGVAQRDVNRVRWHNSRSDRPKKSGYRSHRARQSHERVGQAATP